MSILSCPAEVDVELLHERRGPHAWSGSHCAYHGPAWLRVLLASPQTATQGRGQSWKKGEGSVEGGQPMGKSLQGHQGECFMETDEEDL